MTWILNKLTRSKWMDEWDKHRVDKIKLTKVAKAKAIEQQRKTKHKYWPNQIKTKEEEKKIYMKIKQLAEIDLLKQH